MVGFDTIGNFLQNALYGFSTMAQAVLQPVIQGIDFGSLSGAGKGATGVPGQYMAMSDYRQQYEADPGQIALNLSTYGGKVIVDTPTGQVWIPTGYMDEDFRESIRGKGVFGTIIDDTVVVDDGYDFPTKDKPDPITIPFVPTKPDPPPKPSPSPTPETGGDIYNYSYDYSVTNYDYSVTTYNEAVESVKSQEEDGLFGGMGMMIMMMLLMTGTGLFQQQQAPQQTQPQTYGARGGWIYS